MARLACRCGYIFHFNIETEGYEQCLFQLKFVEEVTEALEEGRLNSDEFSSDCAMNFRDVHPCPECGRVYIETEPRSGIFDIYIREMKRES